MTNQTEIPNIEERTPSPHPTPIPQIKQQNKQTNKQKNKNKNKNKKIIKQHKRTKDYSG
jgi:hypothetical protein